MTDWAGALGIGPVKAQAPEPALSEQTKEVTRKPTATKMSYTARDHETLVLILEHPCSSEQIELWKGEELSTWPRYCEVSNSKLAHLLGMTVGSAAARVARLVKMGVVKPWYDVAVETGKVNRRVIEILQVPPTPWIPD